MHKMITDKLGTVNVKRFPLCTPLFSRGWVGGGGDCPIRFLEMDTNVLVGLRQSISISVKLPTHMLRSPGMRILSSVTGNSPV